MPQLPIADKTTLDAVNAKAGTNTDAAGTTTLFARLKQIYDYLTGNLSSTRAAKIDNLNATVSSRADGAYYTSTRAVKLDNLDAAISSRATAADVTNGAAQVCKASNTTRLSSTAEVIYTRGPNSGNGTILKSFVVPYGGAIRISLDAKTVGSASADNMKISLIGAELLDGSAALNYILDVPLNTYTTFTRDIIVKPGAVVQFMVNNSNYANEGDKLYVKNLYVKYDAVSGPIAV